MISLLAGGLAVGGFAPFYLWPLPLLSLAVLFALFARASSARHSFVLGWWWGLGLFGAGVSWIYVSLSVYGGMSSGLSALATLLFCSVLALLPACAGWLQAQVSSLPALRLLVAMPLAWAATEWLRGWLFTGFPWLGLGYSQVPGGPLAGFAPLVGVYGVTTLLALAAGLLAWSLLTTRPRLRASALVGLVALSAAGYSLRKVSWTQPTGVPTSVALLQGNIAQDMKWQPDKALATMETYLNLAAASPARLIVLPETALPMFEQELPTALLERFRQIGQRNSGDVLLGLPTGSPTGAYYNSVISVGTAATQRYHKSHLVPFGEYIPLKSVWGWVIEVLHIPLSDFSRGAIDQPPLAAGGQRVAVNICYEDVFGEEIIRPLPAASVLVNVSNLAWFGDSFAPWQHAQLSQMRALETGRMMLRATNTGVTAIIDRDGKIVAALPLFQSGSLSGTIQGYTGATPYVRWGNAPVLALWGGLAALLLGRRLRQRH
ncbi:MAG: apolipoprotein N-acyltransferase [Thiobacillus sp.]